MEEFEALPEMGSLLGGIWQAAQPIPALGSDRIGHAHNLMTPCQVAPAGIR